MVDKPFNQEEFTAELAADTEPYRQRILRAMAASSETVRRWREAEQVQGNLAGTRYDLAFTVRATLLEPDAGETNIDALRIANRLWAAGWRKTEGGNHTPV